MPPKPWVLLIWLELNRLSEIDIISPVETEHFDLVRLARGDQCLVGTHGHGVIAAEGGVNVGIGLQN
jgi:hypothetical protein